MKKTHRIILNLLKKSILGDDFVFNAEMISEAEWEEILKFAIEQGIALILMIETCITYSGLNFHVSGLSDIYQRAMVDDMINDILYKPSVGCGHLNLWQKIPNILKCFKRQYKYRKIEAENVFTLICNTITFSSFLHQKVTLD